MPAARLTALPDVGWMLRPITGIPGVRHAVVVSDDGLHLGHASANNLTGDIPELGRGEAEALSAACAALTITSRSAVALFLGEEAGVRQLMVESAQGYVLFTSAGSGASLAVATGADADVALVAQQMQILVVKIGAQLTAGNPPAETPPAETPKSAARSPEPGS
ncbi:roadblock/LC7 domain-containing protein [Streptomyces sp. A7024]|uniref:Roadblock/LC7 domain-containing protein n=1 Tax=Streptomyces coryli TaxID=1128680 RepID=A0A6G4U9Z6_9ACTN|nr:roadblock/LC7 domain-containing protein [Streptomyces coryli]NGN69065.1 roadblock/LC7 domain-containing protein [Streptomyces coryli]